MNRIAHINDKLISLTPRCQHCGSANFDQKELRKTGLKIEAGRVIYTNASPTADVGFCCADCGKLVPRRDAARLVRLPGFSSRFKDKTDA
jgi:hypothetical protein